MHKKVILKPNEELDLLPEQKKGDPLWYVAIRNEETGDVIKEFSFKTEEEANDFIDQVMEDSE